MVFRRNLLFDLCFLEFHMLFCHRVIFAHAHFFGHCPAVLFGYIIEAGISRAHQFDFNGGRLCHGICFRYLEFARAIQLTAPEPVFWRENSVMAWNVK